MDVEFQQNQNKKLYENHKKLFRKYGKQRAEVIIKRINELEAAKDLNDISLLPQTWFHALMGNYEGCYSVDLKHPYRLIFNPLNGDTSDLRTVTKINIREICTDPH